MKKLQTAAVALAILAGALPVCADSIEGRFGMTGGAGISLNASGNQFAPDATVETKDTLTGGGGFIYGINRNLAVTADVTYAEKGLEDRPNTFYRAFDASAGLQYRFRPAERYVPYVGAGLDLFVTDFKDDSGSLPVDTVVGGHLKAGLDLFMSKHFAFNIELKQAMGPSADVKRGSTLVYRYDPTAFTALFGYHLFF